MAMGPLRWRLRYGARQAVSELPHCEGRGWHRKQTDCGAEGIGSGKLLTTVLIVLKAGKKGAHRVAISYVRRLFF